MISLFVVKYLRIKYSGTENVTEYLGKEALLMPKKMVKGSAQKQCVFELISIFKLSVLYKSYSI